MAEPTNECWINTRIEQQQRDKIDELKQRGKYASRSEFLRTAVTNQLRMDLELDVAIRGQREHGKTRRGHSEEQGHD